MKLFRQLEAFGSVPFSHGALLSLLAGYKRPNDKISSLLAAGDIVQLKKGLYVLGEEYRAAQVSLPLIANLLYGPSCVSLESALAWHGLIPEGVMGTTSVTPRRAKGYDTGFGRFSYEHVPKVSFEIGVQLERNPDGSAFLIAGPEKALCDKLLLTRNLNIFTSDAMLRFLEEDLRVDMDELATLDSKVMQQYLAISHKPRQFRALCQAIGELQ